MRQNGQSPRSFGRPGGSAAVTNRVRVARWADRSWAWRLNAVALTAAIGGLLGYLAGQSVGAALAGAGVALSAGAVLVAILTVPGAIAATAVILGTVPLLPGLGSAFTSAATGYADPVGGAVALFMAMGLAVWAMSRWGHGRFWVSLLMLPVATALSVLLLIPAPWLGLNAARFGILVVVAWRCDWLGWLRHWFTSMSASVRKPSVEEVVDRSAADPADVSAAWQRRATAERETADVLAGLGQGFTVFHDVHVKKSAGSLGQLVVGPGGVRMIASVLTTGTAGVDPTGAVVVPGVDLGTTAWALTQLRDSFVKALRVHPRDVDLLIVVHGTEFEPVRLAVGRDKAAGTLIDGYVTVLGAEELLSTVDAGWAVWGESRVRQVSARARVRLRFSTVPLLDVERPSTVQVSLVSGDGQLTPLTPDDVAVSEPAAGLLWSPGTPCSVRTSDGELRGLRVAGLPRVDQSGVEVVSVCTEEAWVTAQAAGVTPAVVFDFPTGSLIRS